MSADSSVDNTTSLRRQLYVLIAVAALCGVLGRIYTFRTPGVKDRPTPFLSANDRSRWCTIVSLVDYGTYAIDAVAFEPESGKRRAGFHTIDMVRHRGTDGQDRYYSSKPVLMPTLLAGIYAVVKLATGATLFSHPFYVGNIVTTLANIPAILGFLVCIAWWLEEYGRTSWGRLTLMVCAAFGTFLTTFAICLNNHLHGAVFAIATVTIAQQIRRNPATASPWQFALTGFFAAMAFANELPALALLVLIALALVVVDFRRTLLCFVPAVSVILLAMVGLNWYAHGDFRPPYSHRNVGAKVADLPLSATAFSETADDAKRDVVSKAADSANVSLGEGWQVVPARKNGRWVIADAVGERRYAIAPTSDAKGGLLSGIWRAVFGKPTPPPDESLALFAWDDWYDYAGTYWTDENVQGVDKGEKSRVVYALHVFLGHHGLFSLSPFWILAIVGGAVAIWRRTELSPAAWLGFLLTGACLFFFVLVVREEDRNYGGVTNGLRWLFWLIPLWLVMAIPAVDWLAEKWWGRGLVLVLLAVNIFSASYGPLNPWSHPWLFHYWEQLGWIDYQ